MINKLEKSVLEDKDNDLSNIVKSFMDSNDDCWHIDRHVIQINDNFLTPNSISIIIDVCQVALSLLRIWNNQRDELIDEVRCDISMPYLIIDDEWLNIHDNTYPPHIYICLAKKGRDCIPVEHIHAFEVEKSGNNEFDQILENNYKLKRLSASFGEDFGAWIVEIP